MSGEVPAPRSDEEAMKAIKFMAVKVLIFAGIPAVAALIAAVYILT